MARLGLSYEIVIPINPRIIYCSISGYGQTGPKRDVAGHDLNYIADSGMLALGMGEGERTVVPPALVADIGGGTYPAIVNILLALRERDRSGQGWLPRSVPVSCPRAVILKKIAASPRQNRLAQALREIGRIERSIFICD